MNRKKFEPSVHRFADVFNLAAKAAEFEGQYTGVQTGLAGDYQNKNSRIEWNMDDSVLPIRLTVRVKCKGKPSSVKKLVQSDTKWQDDSIHKTYDDIELTEHLLKGVI